jgi:DNA-binding NtrC family response regulator
MSGNPKLSVLLLEDEEITGFMMSEVLEFLNCTVDIASTVSKGIELARRKSYDYYLIDIVMNNESGLEAIKHMAITDVARKVIIVSATINSMNIDEARLAGVARFIAKPIKLDDLAKLLK